MSRHLYAYIAIHLYMALYEALYKALHEALYKALYEALLELYITLCLKPPLLQNSPRSVVPRPAIFPSALIQSRLLRSLLYIL